VLTPDGKWLLYQESVDQRFDPITVKVMRAALTGGPSELVIKGQIRDVHCTQPPVALCVCAELSSDARHLIFSVLDPTAGRVSQVMGLDLAPVLSTWDWALSPDGTRIAFIEKEKS
jgi:hypothetical protein